MAEPVRSLYIHVPFCAHKCEYCAFYSAPPSGDILQQYVEALVRELECIAPRCQPQTIFFGGGTPSLLNLSQWDRILSAMARLGLNQPAEWTVECNPATVSADKARLLRQAGVNRISMGVQSFHEPLLERLGRIHTRDQVYRSYDILRQAGFNNINIDLMFAIPGQTRDIWNDTLSDALALETEHLSSYEVIYEEDTPLFAQLKAGEFDVDEDLACEQYDQLVQRLGEAGVVQYEVANFARNHRPSAPPLAPPTTPSEWPAFACQHNINYWRGGDFFGLGPSASEYIQGTRSRNWSNTRFYCEQLAKGQRAIESRETLSPLARAGELAAFGLRTAAGWPYDAFQKTTGFNLQSEWRQEIADAIAKGWAIEEPDRFRLTPSGLRFADAVASDFLRPDDSPSPSVSPAQFPRRIPVGDVSQ